MITMPPDTSINKPQSKQILNPTMYAVSFLIAMATVSYGARPFLNEPDTGLETYLGPDFARGTLPDLSELWCLHDFEWAARNYLNDTAYTWIRYGVGGEYSYRNNLEVFARVGFRPRMLTGNSNVNVSMKTTILGHEFSTPIFISPAAAPALLGGYVPEDRELGLLKGAYNQKILYIPAQYAEVSIEEFGEAKANTSQVTFQQFYAKNNMTFNKDVLDRAAAAGAKAIVWTVDSPADGSSVRGARFTLPPRNDLTTFSWDTLDELRNLTDLPIVLKGILTVEDTRVAVAKGADAIMLSNHGARHLDGAPSPLSVALAIHDEAPELFQQIEIYADGGVRYGVDVLKFMALGVRAVGLGRSFMYANLYGQAGVERAISILKQEILLGAVNLGVTDLSQLNSSWLDLDYLRANPWNMF